MRNLVHLSGRIRDRRTSGEARGEAVVSRDDLAISIRPEPGGPRPVLLAVDEDPAAWPLERAPMTFETSMPAVFAAGDVRYGSVKRMASAVGAGAIAIQSVHEYLNSVPHRAGALSGADLPEVGSLL